MYTPPSPFVQTRRRHACKYFLNGLRAAFVGGRSFADKLICDRDRRPTYSTSNDFYALLSATARLVLRNLRTVDGSIVLLFIRILVLKQYAFVVGWLTQHNLTKKNWTKIQYTFRNTAPDLYRRRESNRTLCVVKQYAVHDSSRRRYEIIFTPWVSNT